MRLILAFITVLGVTGCENRVDKYLRLQREAGDLRLRADIAASMRQNLVAEEQRRGVQTDLIRQLDSLDHANPGLFDSLQRVDAELALMKAK